MPTSLGEPFNPEFACSFVDTFLRNGRAATLIATDNGVYVFTPDVAEHPRNIVPGPANTTIDPAEPYRVRRASPKSDPDGTGTLVKFDVLHSYDEMFTYSTTLPAGSIAEKHAGMVFYAGFDGNKSLQMYGEIENLETKAMEEFNDSLHLGKHIFWWSDPNDPLALNETSLSAVDEGQEITGLKSHNDVLYVFTKRSTYGFIGGIDPSTSRLWKINDIGCTAPHTITTAGKHIYWANHNGIWVSDGQQTLRLSDPIGALFSDTEDATYIPKSLTDPLLSDKLGLTHDGDFGLVTGLGYPWKIDKEWLKLATAVHNPIHHQLWFNVPVLNSLRRDTGTIDTSYQWFYSKHINSLTLVYDYELQAWSFYAAGNFSYSNFCSDAVYWPEKNQMLIASVSSIEHTADSGSNAGRFTTSIESFPHPGQDFSTPMYQEAWTASGGDGAGVSAMDAEYKATKRSVPYAWCSSKLFRENQDYVDVRRPRITMLSWGHQPKRRVPISLTTELFDWGPAWFLETEDAAFNEWKDNTAASGLSAADAIAQSGMLQCHPKAYDNVVGMNAGAVGTATEETAQPAFFWSGVDSLGKNGDLTYGKWDSDTSVSSDRMVWSETEWFTQTLYYPEGNLAGRSIRIGVVHPDYWNNSTQKQGHTVQEDTYPGPIGAVRSFPTL